MKISKKMRADAAMLCSGAASNPYALFVFESFDVSQDAVVLACDAFRSALDYGGDYDNDDLSLEWAEAEALLRCGWSP